MSLQNKLKVLALKTTTNINTLIKDLFHNPPSYKNMITLSWKPTVKASAATATAAATGFVTKLRYLFSI